MRLNLQFPLGMRIVSALFAAWAAAAPALAATPRECSQFLRHNPVRQQCGPTCVTHTLIGVLEMHMQKRLSVEHALMAGVAQAARAPELQNSAPGVQAWLTALLALGYGGVETEEEFSTPENRKWFEQTFGVPLSEEGILQLRPQLSRLDQHREWLNHESHGRSRWRQISLQIRFEFLTSDHAAHIKMASYQDKLRALGLDISFGYVPKDEVEIEIDHSLNVGYPVAVILEPKRGHHHSEIATHRTGDGSIVTRNTAKVTRWWFWEVPAPILERSSAAFHRELIGALLIWDN